MNNNDNIDMTNIKLLSYEGNPMKIKSLKISGVGGITELGLTFNEQFNVICGANGIGKTTILNTIADAFTHNHSELKRNFQYTVGSYSITLLHDNGEISSREYNIKEFNPNEINYKRSASEESFKLLTFGTNRTIEYIPLESVPKDQTRDMQQSGDLAQTGILYQDIKGWFINRILFRNLESSLSMEQLKNNEIAKSAFGLLDSNVTFDTIDASSLDIILNESGNKLFFEYLSSGYKTCIYIVLGIIKEIEFRFNEHCVSADKFDGVILIDEIDMHLHPTWQAALVKSLKTVFPCAQFIVTTHSPSVLQSLEKDEIIPLGIDENNNTFIKELNLGEYGLQGWTLEEILKYVMDMPETTSVLYRETLKKFDEAMNNEDKESILREYNLLKEMLHPDSTLRKLLTIQVAEWED